MSKYPFHDGLTLAEEAERLGKKAVKLGLIPTFSVDLFPDCWQFYLPTQLTNDPLTPEEAYLHFKKLVQQ